MSEINPTDNTQILKKFVKINNLKNNNSLMFFLCEYHFENTNGKTLIESGSARIEFEGFNNYGTFEMNKYYFNANDYPAGFDAKFQHFNLDGNDLIITGIHSKNTSIGTYRVQIKALGIDKNYNPS
ncbi:MAG: hypothetical protein EOO43_08875 [Flavobacterium sp.]|nr:MAG: hypothetical protein EOO43_08875 [Flavobacterium sp.]